MLLLIFLWKNFKVLSCAYRVSHLCKWLKIWCGDWIIMIAVSLFVKKPVQLPNYDQKPNRWILQEWKYSNRTVTAWYKKCMKSQERNCQGSHHDSPLSKSILCIPCLFNLCCALKLCHTAVLFKGFYLCFWKQFNCTAPSNSTAP